MRKNDVLILGVMKRARWGATHRIHEHFVDGFPELEERFVRERDAAERRFEYNLGSRNFASKREGEEGIDTLKVLFRKLDRAIGLRDADMVQSLREEFLTELRHWNWRKGARVEFKRRKMVHQQPQEDDDTDVDNAGDLLNSLSRPISLGPIAREEDTEKDDYALAPNNNETPTPRKKKRKIKPGEKQQVNDARRRLLAESVAVALVTLKWRCLNPNSKDDTNADEVVPTAITAS